MLLNLYKIISWYTELTCYKEVDLVEIAGEALWVIHPRRVDNNLILKGKILDGIGSISHIKSSHPIKESVCFSLADLSIINTKF